MSDKQFSDGPIIVKSGSVSVKIYEVNTGKYSAWSIEYYNAAGARERVKRSSLKVAKQKAKEIADDLAMNFGANLQLSATDAAQFNRAVEILRPTGKSLEVAITEYVELLQQLRPGYTLAQCVHYTNSKTVIDFTPKTMLDLLQTFKESKERENLSEKYLTGLSKRLNRAAEYFKCPIHTITAADITKWMDELRDARTSKLLSPQSRIHYRTGLETFFGSAVAKPHLPTGWDEIKSVAVPKTIKARVVIYTPEQMTTLLYGAAGFIELPVKRDDDVADEDMPVVTEELKEAFRSLVPYLAIGAFGGTRNATDSGEVSELDWTDIDFDGNQIILDNGVGKVRDRYIPMQPNLRAWLMKFAKKSGPILPPGAMKRRQKLCRLLGVKWIPNGLRKSFISYRIAQTGDAAMVASEAGNSPEMIYTHYRKAIPKQLGERWFSIVPPESDKIVQLPGKSVEPTLVADEFSEDRKVNRGA